MYVPNCSLDCMQKTIVLALHVLLIAALPTLVFLHGFTTPFAPWPSLQPSLYAGPSRSPQSYPYRCPYMQHLMQCITHTAVVIIYITLLDTLGA